MNAVAANLRRLRKARHLTQDALAQRLHVTRQTISGWETGRTQPDLNTLTALASALEVDLSALIYDTPPQSPLCPISWKAGAGFATLAALGANLELTMNLRSAADLPGLIATLLFLVFWCAFLVFCRKDRALLHWAGIYWGTAVLVPLLCVLCGALPIQLLQNMGPLLIALLFITPLRGLEFLNLSYGMVYLFFPILFWAVSFELYRRTEAAPPPKSS